MSALTMKEIYQRATRLRDALATAGQADEALRLHDWLTCPWTTSSEALVELLTLLDDTRGAWERRLGPDDAAFADQLLSDSRDLLDFK
jgi:hypothetical protein